MRRLFVFLLAMCTLALAVAQDAPATLSVSQSMFAVKVTDPQRQVTAFQPLLSRIDNLAETLKPGGGKPSAMLTTFLTEMAKTPGIDATGEFWFVMTPKGAPVAKEGDKEAGAIDPMPFGAMAVLIPIKNAEQFKAFAAGDGKDTFGKAQVFDNYMAMSIEGNLPKYAGINTTVTLQSTRDIVIMGSMRENPLTQFKEQAAAMGPMAGFVSSLSRFIDEVIANQQSFEAGLAMVGDDLSLESFLTPVPGSPLAKALATPQPSALPLTLAGYLPENLAMCSSSGPQLVGAPGAGQVLFRIFTGLLGSFLEPDQAKQFDTQLQQMANQCSNGRAIGLTVPPANLQTGATLVAVYHVENAQTAAGVTHGFLQELIRAKDNVFGGMVMNVVKIFTKPNAEMVYGVPVDLIKIVIPTGDPAAKPAPKPVTIEGRIATLNDTLLIAIGDGSKAEITGMIDRVKNGTAGFTASKRFAVLKAGLPEGARGFESYATLDLCRAGASLVPVAGETKKQITKFFAIFPEQKMVLSNYQEIRDGRLHSDFRIPGEQLDFFSSLIKSAAMFNQGGPKPAPAKPASKK